ncbi:MAG: ThiF family adenylyltransferase [Puniceicoccales bacterium]|jgi:adenylyltransferase/sulfurtransferase|nr:ThiF family adenylyltransferase [Puniceicoccales bacterium]
MNDDISRIAPSVTTGGACGGILELPALGDADRLRYSRHTRLPQIGEIGQRRLLGARVLVVGLGGLGSPAALYLAAAGVGTIGVAEPDTVAAHNLQRQILFRDADAAGSASKLDAGFAALRALNPRTRLVAHAEGVTPANAAALIAGYDVVLDGSDNFATRYLVADAAALARRPLVHGSVFQFEGQVAVFDPAAGGPCYRCLFPRPPAPETVPTCAQAGVLGALCGVVGSWMALEAVKVITGAGNAAGKFIVLDLLTDNVRVVSLPRNPACPLCGDAPSITEIRPENYDFGATCCGGTGGGAGTAAGEEITCEEFAELRAATPALPVLDVRERDERDAARIEGTAHIPLGELAARLDEVRALLGGDATARLVVHCQRGGRSLSATRLLRAKGFSGAVSLAGGLERWLRAGA